MSTLKVNTINAATSGQAVAVDISNPKSFRNLIINGAMKVAQRGTSSLGSSEYGSVDRFWHYYQNVNESPTFAQVDVASGTTPYTLGFRKAFKITNGNQTSGAGASNQVQIEYRCEAQDIAQSGWDYTSASSYVTLSFWVKSSVAQVFNLFVKTEDGTEKNMPLSTPSLTANTWTKVSFQIKGDSGISVNNDIGNGLTINFGPFLGTDYTSNSITNGEWIAWNGGTRSKDYTTTWYNTNDATFEMTGVQLEVGEIVTDFEHRSYGDELARCQRYCQFITAGDNDHYFGPGYYYNSTNLYMLVRCRPQMRSTPTVVQTTGTNYYTFYRDGSGDTFNGFDGISWTGGTTNAGIGGALYVNTNTSGTAGMAGAFYSSNNACKLLLSAEL
jgi:hypothetical protein